MQAHEHLQSVMVLLGLGILVASLTFLLLRSPSMRWRGLIERWKHHEDGNATIQLTKPKQGTQTEGIIRADAYNHGDHHSERHRVTTPQEPVEQKQENRSPLTTPKATPLRPHTEQTIPTFILDDSQNSSVERKPHLVAQLASVSPSPIPRSKPSPLPRSQPQKPRTNMPPPTIPALKSNPTTSKTSTLLMPPPPRPSALRALPKAGNTLNPPPSAASALRVPLSLQKPTTSTLASNSTLAPSARPSRKVTLTPGHSPLDWAALTAHPPTSTFLRGAALPPSLIRVTPSMLRVHNGRKGSDAWSTWHGRVYNVSPYRKFHPGGEGELMRGAGKAGEAERLFGEIHPWVNWEGILGECLVGVMVSEGDGGGGEKEEGGLEEMD